MGMVAVYICTLCKCGRPNRHLDRAVTVCRGLLLSVVGGVCYSVTFDPSQYVGSYARLVLFFFLFLSFLSIFLSFYICDSFLLRLLFLFLACFLSAVAAADAAADM